MKSVEDLISEKIEEGKVDIKTFKSASDFVYKEVEKLLAGVRKKYGIKTYHAYDGMSTDDKAKIKIDLYRS